MARHDSAASVLEFLTHTNPKVLHLPPKHPTNTRDVRFYWPKEVQKWDQFENLDILRSAFGGRLYQAAIRAPSTPLRYPYYNEEIDCSIRDEKKTKTLIDKWNHSIVTQALQEVDEFRPSYWANDDPSSSLDKSPPSLSPESSEDPGPASSPTGRRQPSRNCGAAAKRLRQPSRHRRVPDAGSIMLSGEPSEPRSAGPQARFLKEYKPAGKWSSDKSIEQQLLSTGRATHPWREKDIRKKQAWPIRQAFTYCVDYKCRYGCILTCQEAFIFRIQPLEQEPDTTRTPAQLRRALIDKGKMEYVSIPWANHSQGEESSDAGVWTVNLALWFIHVLAGHRYEAAWTYDMREHESLGDSLLLEPQAQAGRGGSGHPDEEETAVFVAVRDSSGNEDDDSDERRNDEGEESETSSESTEADDTQRSKGNPVTPSKKRKWEPSDSNDPIHFSFSKHRA